MTTVIVFGGTGFLGRRLVRRLVAERATVCVAVRHPEQAQNALRAAGLDGVTVFRADVRDQASVTAARRRGRRCRQRGLGLCREWRRDLRGRARARRRDGRGRRWRPASRASSSSPASPPIPGRGRRTSARGRGELVVRQALPGATIIRPGAMFGPGDAVFGTLAELARLLPVLPLIGGGRTRLQPVYVEDVAEAISRILADSGTAGETYELAGPEVCTLRELVRIVLRLIGRWRPLVPVPFAVAEVHPGAVDVPNLERDDLRRAQSRSTPRGVLTCCSRTVIWTGSGC